VSAIRLQDFGRSLLRHQLQVADPIVRIPNFKDALEVFGRDAKATMKAH
jgi:hypothetical protein